MWITILLMAIAISLEPFRIGMTVLMLNRPRPTLQLLVFLCSGFTMGMTVGFVVLFVFRRRLMASMQLTLPKVQILIGVLALLVAAVLTVQVCISSEPPAESPVDSASGPPKPSKWAPRPLARLLNGDSLWVAGVAGLGIALPSVDYLAALAVILTSGAAATTQVGALLMFNVVAFALIEIPLAAYLLAPDTTRAWTAALNNWIRSRRRLEVATLLAGVSCLLLAVGIAGL
ncbi:hypothetical protein JK2ML_1233 [Mycobacterium leprae Kyoto-2]|uniref:Conserved membrane protein n=3 Tax=Mycobacterium leprae TaxID=1769 RepID=Q49630_MYCLE|nr:GAP family protein [Mycobacterium leprae]CAR71328.1 conserved membrane protein [Mycobacterium leprae Br4923]AAA17078.1 Lepb1170_F2_64 [Mycobacterium leprae]AWV47866.1 GAP family protein [Mycobacterium leprae]OAR20551.1 hypothetical protein A8144_10555 [Mycobacterium leprae 3125609]OAX70747.1 hypothetical protein A3216_10090 [Mycobacterium leprae 7935681]